MSLFWPPKDADEVLDYQIDWVNRLAGDTILNSTWVVPSGIIQDNDENTDTTTTIWLSGGTEGDVYECMNRIVTTDGRTMDQSVRLKIKAR